MNVFKFQKPRFVDPVEQYEKAIEAFESNGFIVLVDDYQMEGVDKAFLLAEDKKITDPTITRQLKC